jgi:hypothetical protein
LGEIRIRLNVLQDGSLDRRAVAFTLFEAAHSARFNNVAAKLDYNSSKGAVWLLSKSVALRCARNRWDIRCNSVHPTFIRTPIIDSLIAGRDETTCSTNSRARCRSDGLARPETSLTPLFISLPTKATSCREPRSSSMAAFRPCEMAETLNSAALAEWLGKSIDSLRGPIDIRQFSGGQPNPTYLLATPGRKYVLRKKPHGALLSSAHAIDRQYRVMRARQDTDVSFRGC